VGETCSIHEIDEREIEIFVRKLQEKQRVGELTMKLESNNSPHLSVSTTDVSVLFLKLWYPEIHVGCEFNATVLRFCLCTSVLLFTRIQRTNLSVSMYHMFDVVESGSKAFEIYSSIMLIGVSLNEILALMVFETEDS